MRRLGRMCPSWSLRACCAVAILSAALLAASRPATPALAQAPESGGYWRFVKMLYNEDEQHQPGYPGTWSPSYSENSLSGSYTYTPPGGETYTLEGTCSWSWQSGGSLDQLLPGQVVTVTLSITYSGIDNEKYGNSLSSYAAWDAAGCMGACTYTGAIGTEMIQVWGPSGQATRTSEITIPGGPMFPDSLAALEVTCQGGWPVSPTAQRVYEWIEATPEPTAEPTTTTIDCDNVALLSYSPQDPEPGSRVYLTVGMDQRVSGADGFEQVWLVDGVEDDDGIIEDYNGCGAKVEYRYTCGGSQYSERLTIGRGDCTRNTSWVLVVGGLAAVGAAAAAIGRSARSRGKGKGQNARHYILQLSTQRLELAPGETRTLTATAWRVLPDGGYTAAPEATVRFQLPLPASGLRISPLLGEGSCRSEVSAGETAEQGEHSIGVEATAAGARVTAHVTVAVRGQYELEIF